MLTLDELILFSLLPMLSAIGCAYLLYRLRRRPTSIAAYALFINLLILSTSQTLGYWVYSFSHQAAWYFADIYLIAAYFFFTHLALFALDLSEKDYKFKCFLYVFPTILTLLHLSGFMVESYRLEQSSLMHNDGVAAKAFDAYALLSLSICLFILFRNYKTTVDRIMKSKSVIMLYSFIPLMVVLSLLALLSATKYALSTAFVSPMIILYTSFTYYYITKHDIIDCSNGSNFFINRLKLAYSLLKTTSDIDDIKQFKREFEAQLILECMAKHKNKDNQQIKYVAEEMGIHHTTLRSKIKEYKIPYNTKDTL